MNAPLLFCGIVIRDGLNHGTVGIATLDPILVGYLGHLTAPSCPRSCHPFMNSLCCFTMTTLLASKGKAAEWEKAGSPHPPSLCSQPSVTELGSTGQWPLPSSLLASDHMNSYVPQPCWAGWKHLFLILQTKVVCAVCAHCSSFPTSIIILFLQHTKSKPLKLGPLEVVSSWQNPCH